MKIELRKATVTDIPGLVEIEKELDGSRIYSAMTTEEEWREELSNPNATVYLILENGEAAGDVSYERKGNGVVRITGLAIRPAFQGKGVGKQVMKVIIEELKDFETVELLTHPENERAINLYKGFGFEQTGVWENPFKDGEPRIVMTRRT